MLPSAPVSVPSVEVLQGIYCLVTQLAMTGCIAIQPEMDTGTNTLLSQPTTCGSI